MSEIDEKNIKAETEKMALYDLLNEARKFYSNSENRQAYEKWKQQKIKNKN